jgi:chromate transporter
VVGVIASLAVFFGEHVFHAGANWDWAAVAIAAAAAWALLRWHAGPAKLLAACAIAGLVLHYANGINDLVQIS